MNMDGFFWLARLCQKEKESSEWPAGLSLRPLGENRKECPEVSGESPMAVRSQSPEGLGEQMCKLYL